MRERPVTRTSEGSPMSYKSGTYVLVTTRPDGVNEYRVTHANADGLSCMFDDFECGCDPYWSETCDKCRQWEAYMCLQRDWQHQCQSDQDGFLVPAQVIEFFGKCEVFTDRDAAFEHASQIDHWVDDDGNECSSYIGVYPLWYEGLPFPALASTV